MVENPNLDPTVPRTGDFAGHNRILAQFAGDPGFATSPPS